MRGEMGPINGFTIKQCEGLLTKGKTGYANPLSRLWENCKVVAKRIFYLFTRGKWVSDKKLTSWSIGYLQANLKASSQEQEKIIDFCFDAFSRAVPKADLSLINPATPSVANLVYESEWTVDENLNNLNEFISSLQPLKPSQLLEVLEFAESLREVDRSESQEERLATLIKKAFSTLSLRQAREYSKDLNLKKYFLLFHYDFIIERFLRSETLNPLLLKTADELNLEKSQQARSKKERQKIRKEFYMSAQSKLLKYEKLPELTRQEKDYCKKVLHRIRRINQEENFAHFLDLIKNYPQTIIAIRKIVSSKQKALLTNEEIRLICDEVKSLRDKIPAEEFKNYVVALKRCFNKRQFPKRIDLE